MTFIPRSRLVLVAAAAALGIGLATAGRAETEARDSASLLAIEAPTSFYALEEVPTDVGGRAVLVDKGCRVWMPLGNVTQGSRQLPVGSAETEQMVEFDFITTNPPSARFAMAASAPIDPALAADPEPLLEELRDRILRDRSGFQLVSNRTLIVDGHPAQESILRNAEETVAFRVIYAQQRLFVLAIGQRHEVALANGGAVTEFFDSFELL